MIQEEELIFLKNHLGTDGKLIISDDLTEDQKLKLALKYQIFTKNTSLFAEVEFTEKITEEMKSEILGDKENNVIKKKRTYGGDLRCCATRVDAGYYKAPLKMELGAICCDEADDDEGEDEDICFNIRGEYYKESKGGLVSSYAYSEEPNLIHREYMEDTGIAIENFNNDPNKILFGLFDGHGGEQVSKFLQKNFALYMKQMLPFTNHFENFVNLFKIF